MYLVLRKLFVTLEIPKIQYIKGITEPLTRILKSHDIRVTNKPIKTLHQEFPVPKFRPRVDDQ